LPSGQSDERKVFFYDHSAIMGKGARWYWEFPGSVQGTSTDENPIIDYETAIPGKYSVRLTITDRKGRKSFCELKDFIEVRNNEPWNLRTIKLEKEADEHKEEEE
jgi:PKD repeat protein